SKQHELQQVPQAQPTVVPSLSQQPPVPAVPSANPVEAQQVAETPASQASVQQSTQEVQQVPVQTPVVPVKEEVSEAQPVSVATGNQQSSRRALEEQAAALSQVAPGEKTSSGKESVEEHKPSGFGFSGILRVAVASVIIVIVLLIVWGIGSMLFSGQGGQSGKVTLTYWGIWEDQNVMQPILDDFQKQHPNITVTYSRQDPKDYTKRLL